LAHHKKNKNKNRTFGNFPFNISFHLRMQSEKVRTLDKPYEIKLRIPAQHCLENTSFVLERGRRLIFGFHEAAMYYC
jgi:hypothetical protein